MNSNRGKRSVPKYGDNKAREVLSFIRSDLKDDNIFAMKFLLRDVLPKSVLKKGILDIFEALENKDVMNSSNPWLVIECLMNIHRNDLVEECFKDLFKSHSKTKLPTGLISPYRIKLLEISMDLVQDEKMDLVFLFGDLIPKLKAEESKTTLDVFSFLEETRVIGPDNTDSLQSVLNRIQRPNLADALKQLPSVGSAGEDCSQRETANKAKAKFFRGRHIKDKFYQTLRGKTCEVVYKRPQRLVGMRYIFEVKGGEALEDLIQFKLYLNGESGTWSGVSSPMLDSGLEYGKWEVCLWCRKMDFSPDIPPPETECIIKLTDVNIFFPEKPGPRDTIVNIVCSKTEKDW